MITWAERAKAAISQNSQNGTVKTDETPVLSVLAVDAEAVSVMAEGLSSVLSVPSPGYFENLQGARQETRFAVVSPKSRRHGATETTEAAEQDDLWPRLEAIANKCCDHWRDSAERRAEMLADLRAMTPQWQRLWIEHLEANYGKPK